MTAVQKDLRTRVAAVVSAELCRQQHAIDPHRVWQWFDMGPVADAVIRELDLGIPCAATGCRMRQIARRHAKASSGLTELPTWGVPSFDNGENR